MSQIVNIADIYRLIAQGKSYKSVAPTSSGTASTAGAAASGFFTAGFHVNSIGTTMPSTLESIHMPPITTSQQLRLIGAGNRLATAATFDLVRMYLFGTMSALTPTGDRFTHDAATFPVLRTMMGQASQPVDLTPMLNITTATTTTAAVMRLRTAAGGTGYTDQDGNATVGTKTITLPSATTARDSCYIFRLEDGDSAVRDISAVEVTTAAAVGAASVWGIEHLATLTYPNVANVGDFLDYLYSTPNLVDISPAVATSGSVVSRLALLRTGATASAAQKVTLHVIVDS